jgi:hypothetical protein
MVKRLFITTILSLLTIYSCQTGNDNSTWTKEQITYHETFLNFCKYVDNKKINELPLDTLFKKYIYFDYVLSDTSAERKDRRLQIFPSVLESFQHNIDSIGADNIEARPISYYEKDAEFFEPFTLQLKDEIPDVLAYYKKGQKDKPIGTILFERKTGKIVAWIIINQGGYYYYMIFNLV